MRVNRFSFFISKSRVYMATMDTALPNPFKSSRLRCIHAVLPCMDTMDTGLGREHGAKLRDVSMALNTLIGILAIEDSMVHPTTRTAA
jgi:hypothetical protein